MRNHKKIISRVFAVALALIIALSSLVIAFGTSMSGGHRGSQYWGIKWKNEVEFNYTDAQGKLITGKMGSRNYGGRGWMQVHYFALNGQNISVSNYAQRAFCIELEKNIEGVVDPNTSYNYVYDGTGNASYNANTGLAAYDSRLQPEKKKLLNYVLANGYGNYVPAVANRVAYWYATQLLIYEVVAGRRDSNFNVLYGGFNPTNCLIEDTEADALAYVPTSNHKPETTVNAIQQAYNDIVSWVMLTLKNPAGTSESSSNPTKHIMTYDSTLGKYVYDYSFNDIIRQDLQNNSNFAVQLSKLNLRQSDIKVYDDNNRVSYTIDKANKRIRFTANKAFSGSVTVAFANNPRIRGINESLASTAQAGLMIIGHSNSNVQAFARGASKLINRPAYFQLSTSNVEKVKMKKVSANPEITEGNSCYTLAGAVYGLYNDAACTSLAGKLITDANGDAVYGGGNGTVFGAKNLWAKEISPSPGYTLDKNIYPVTNSGTIDEDGVPIYTFTSIEVPENDPITVFLQKKNALTGQSGADLKGAVFKVCFYGGEYSDAADVQDLTALRTWYFETDEDGIISYDTDHLIQNNPQYPSGALYIDTATGKPALPNGSLSVQEVKAPTNYKINTDILVKPVDLLNDYGVDQEPINPFVVDEVPVGGLSIQKSSSDGIIKDIWFRVQGDTGYQGGYNKVFKTNNKGLIIIKDDPDMYVTNGEGQLVEYTITELGFANGDGTYTIPARYTPDHISQTTTIDGEGGVTVKFKNQTPLGEIDITKQADDGVTNNIYFQITGTNGFNRIVMTGDRGSVHVKNLPVYDKNDNLITYTVKELGVKIGNQYKIPERYHVPVNQTVTFTNATVGSNNITAVYFHNEIKTGELRIKKSADDGDINDIYFRVKNNSNNTELSIDEIIKTTNGVAELDDLPVYDENDMEMTYTVTELGKKVGTNQYKVPGYYFEVEPQTVKLDATSTEPKEVSFENKVKYMKLLVHKSSTDDMVEGVCFRIVSSDGKINKVLVTDDFGEIYLEDLYCVDTNGKSITYTITELGFKNSSGGYTFPARYYEVKPQVVEGIDYVYSATEANADFYNKEKKAAIRINKFSEDNVVENIWFRLTNSATNKVIDMATTSSGIVDFSNLKVYDNNGNKITYTVTELGIKKTDGTYEIPYRYKSVQPKTLTLNCNETDPQDMVLNEVDFENTLKKGSVTINKKDNNDTPLAGVIYELHKKDGTLVGTKTTSSGGVASFSNLDQGDYYIVETKTVAGFNLLKDKIEFTVSGESNSTLHPKFDVKETPNFKIPYTGENGILSLCIGGGIVLVAGILIIVLIKVKKNKK